MTSQTCRVLCLTAPASNQGKTLIAAALARQLRNQGLRVRVFKVGPDFLDPTILARASGTSVYNLDGWMGGLAHCRQLLYTAALSADYILIEGVMGLFDGPSSTADLALALGLPVAAVIDATGMGQSLGAIALGLAHYQPELLFRGVLANGIASERHEQMLREGVPKTIDYLGGCPRSPQLRLPSRHLGLVPASELSELDGLLDEAALLISKTRLADAALPVTFMPIQTTPPRLLDGVCIAIARDAAFAFLYPANLDCLSAMGAELVFFSPLTDTCLPNADAVYLPGGYPELHLTQLASNHAMQQALRAHAAANKPLYAECGGLLYLLESLSDVDGHSAAMLGLLPGSARLGQKLAALGYQSLLLPQGELRGHTFHYSSLTTPLTPLTYSQALRSGCQAEAFYQQGSLRASYLHLYFPYAPAVAAGLFSATPL